MWLVPKTLPFSPSAPVAQAWTSASDWPFQLAASSAGLNGKPSPPRNWFAAWKRASWMQRLVGAICEPSTVSRGVAQWISSLLAIRASRSVQPADVVGKTIHAICGPTFAALLKKCSPKWFSSRMSVGTSLWGSERSSKTWSDWTLKLRLLSSRRRKLARRIAGSGCSSLVEPVASSRTTPQAHDERKRSEGQTSGRLDNGAGNACLSTDAEHWTTPRVTTGEYTRDQGKKGQERMTLEGESATWSTPNAHDGRRPGVDDKSTQVANLQRDAALWPTPDANVFQDGHEQTAEQWEARKARLKLTANNGNGCGTPLTMAANLFDQQWATPSATEVRQGYQQRPDGMASEQNQQSLTTECVDFLSSLPAPASVTDGQPSSETSRISRPRLNPVFVAWLMNWPATALGYSDFSEMESCRFKLPTPSVGCGSVWEDRMMGELRRRVE